MMERLKMFFKKSFMILAIVVTLISLTAVSAADDNIAGNLNNDDMTFESSVNDEILLEDSNDLDGCDDGKLGQINQYNLADEGEFIDVEDAYIFLNQFRNESGVWQCGHSQFLMCKFCFPLIFLFLFWHLLHICVDG